MEKLFTYGTLQYPEIQEKLLRRTLIGVSDTLLDYELKIGVVEIDGEKFDAATDKPGERINGVVYELSKDELHKIDQYEGKSYKRIKVNLLSGVESWVYIQS